jgi:hypothetical protein
MPKLGQVIRNPGKAISNVVSGVGGAVSDAVSTVSNELAGLEDATKVALANPAVQLVIAYYLPGAGELLATQLGVSTAVGMGIASVGVQVASGVPLETAIVNAGVSAGVSAGAQNLSPEIRAAFNNNNGLADAVTSMGASAVKTAATGGSQDDILKAGIAGAAGSVVTTATGDRVLGAAATGGITGGVAGAASAAAGAAGTEAANAGKTTAGTNVSSAEQQLIDTFAKSEATQGLSSAIDSANLTPDERAFLKDAQQQVYNQSLTAQALPVTTDGSTSATTRIGPAFAANDPRFISAVQKNPTLIGKFSEYTNSYGASNPAMNAAFTPLLESALKENPTDQNLLDEYKKVTGKDYSAAGADTSNMGVIEITAPRDPNIVIAPGTQFKPGTAPNTANLPGTTPSTAASANAQAGVAAQPSDSAARDFFIGNLADPVAVANYARNNRFTTGDISRIFNVDVGIVKDYLGENVIDSPGATTPTTNPDGTPSVDTPTTTPTTDYSGGDSGGYSEPEPPPPPKDTTNITIASVKTPKLRQVTQPTTFGGTGSSPLQQALTAYRPAGEIEDVSSGKEQQNVWNESSLRLKDALGI